MFLAPILSFLKLIPWWAYAIAAVLGWGMYQRHLANASAAHFQAAQRAASDQREKALVKVVVETARRQAAVAVVAENAKVQVIRAKAAADSASAAASSLRDRLIALQADNRAAADSGSIAAGQATRLADILGRCADRYSEVAARADAAIISGNACVASYEALTH